MKRIIEINKKDLSYIAGFLDGDGSLIAQLVKGEYRYGYRIRLSIVFYQKTEKYWFLEWLKKKLRYGSIRKRTDGVSDYTITASKAVEKVLKELLPYLRIKKAIGRDILEIIRLKKVIESEEEFIRVCELVDKVAEQTYGKRKSISVENVKRFISEKKGSNISSP